MICESMKSIFEITSDKKINELTMPVLGSGHGGLDISISINLILLGIKFYSNKYHHLEKINILIYSKENKSCKIKISNIWSNQ